MRNKQEILKRILDLEYESGQLLDKQTEEDDSYELHQLQDKRDILSLRIEELLWVLNE